MLSSSVCLRCLNIIYVACRLSSKLPCCRIWALWLYLIAEHVDDCDFLLPGNYMDLAFRQPSVQISTDPEDAVASNAVDGNPSTFAQTKNQSNPFWYVDLGESKLVRHLQITPHDTQRKFCWRTPLGKSSRTFSCTCHIVKLFLLNC